VSQLRKGQKARLAEPRGFLVLYGRNQKGVDGEEGPTNLSGESDGIQGETYEMVGRSFQFFIQGADAQKKKLKAVGGFRKKRGQGSRKREKTKGQRRKTTSWSWRGLEASRRD